ncbi:hypothetical protein GCM10027456_81680 [Kineosporia babensis]
MDGLGGNDGGLGSPVAVGPEVDVGGVPGSSTTGGEIGDTTLEGLLSGKSCESLVSVVTGG